MKKILFLLAGILLIGIGWYGLSPLFMNKHIEDTIPTADKAPMRDDGLEVENMKANEASESATTLSEPIPIVDTLAHPASGQVRIVHTGNETIVRYENYKTINGPDVRVYLANDLNAKDFVDLGPIKGTEGNINYSVPSGVDINKYRYVLTWCEDFSVLFNSADLSIIRQ